jgi:histidinol-phosphatase
MTDKPSDLLEFAEEVAWKAGEITLKYFGEPIDVDLKDDNTPVTVADRSAEDLIRSEIERRFPDHGILGEEHGATRPGADFQWIVDPIDGTKAFIRGVPLYGVMIALEERGESRIGVVHHPALGLTAAAEVGHGTRINGEPARVADARTYEETAVLSSDFAGLWLERPEFAAELMRRFPLQRTWGDCYGYTMVASGRAQAMIDPEMSRWDLAALKPIIEEAGGMFTDLDGVRTAAGEHSLAATPRIHAEIMKLLRA